MPLHIVRNDITKMKVTAIVNAANNSLLGGGGVDGAIHRAAGKELLAECKTLGGCETGKAKITKGYNLPAEYVIHTVGPIYYDGKHGEKELLESCYRESLKLAIENNCESVAFPLISSGIYGYPKDKALKVAIDTIGDFLFENDITVYLVIFDKASFNTGEKLFPHIAQYIDDNYVSTHSDFLTRSERMHKESRKTGSARTYAPSRAQSSFDSCTPCYDDEEKSNKDLTDKLKNLDESFSQMLLRKIDEKGMKDSECYKKANVDRKLFSKIRSDILYRPSKATAIAFAIALELSIEETEDFLKKAGFALSKSNKFDIIIEYFITKGIYNVFEINEALFAFDQNLLGG